MSDLHGTNLPAAAGERPVVTIPVEGVLDGATVDAFWASCTGSAPAGDLVLDVGRLTFVDSVGLHALIVLAQRRGERGETVTLRNPGRQLMRLLELTGVRETLLLVAADEVAADEGSGDLSSDPGGSAPRDERPPPPGT